MNRLSMKVFTGNGSWTCPAGVTAIIVGGRGGSGGGSGGGTQPCGGSGCFTAYKIVAVTPNTTYTITIGSGGAGTTTSIDGFDGTSTTFGSVATFIAGSGGMSNGRNAVTTSIGPVIGGGHFAFNAGLFSGSGPTQPAMPGQASPYAAGGAVVSAYAGGAGGDGAGGAGGATGSNGGGGGAYNGSTVGDGTSGQLILIWSE